MSFPRYLEYKDSGVEWLGEVPKHWDVERLKYNTYAKGRIGWQNLRADEFVDEGPYLVTGMHFRNQRIDWEACYHISEERFQLAPEIQLRASDVLITKDGTIGKLAYVDELPGPATLNSHLLVLRPLRDRYTARFLLHALSSNGFSTYLDENQTGTTFFGVSQESVVNFPLTLPPLSEQLTICGFLDHETAKIDGLVAEQEKLIALLKEKRQAVISHAVTKGLNPDAPMKDSGIEWLGEVPAHWQVGPLKRFADVMDCKHHTVQFLDEGWPIVSIRELREDRIDLNDAKLTSREEWEFLRDGRIPQPGDMIFCRNASVGAVGYVDFDEPFCMGQDVCLIRPDSKSQYMHFQLTSILTRNQIEALLVGATIRRANVEEIRCLLVAHPSPDEQNEIAKYLSAETTKFDALSADAEQAIGLLKERRSALISAAVTGKIDVREFA